MSKAVRHAMCRTVLACGLAMPGVMLAPSSKAGGRTDEATAQALFDDGRQLMARGEFVHACPRFEESQRLDTAVGTLLNLADCYEKTNRLASAWSTFLDAASAAREAGEGERERAAQERALALEPRLPKIVVHVLREPRVPGLTVMRDGRPIGQEQFDLPVPTDVGTHIVTASAPGRRPWENAIAVGGEATVTTITVPYLAEAPATSSEVTSRSSWHALGAQRTIALVAAGIALGGLGVGAGFLASAKSEDDQANALCPATACSNVDAVNKSHDAARDAAVATAAFAAAGSVLAAATVVWFTAKPPVQPRPAEAATKLGVGLGTLQLRGAW